MGRDASVEAAVVEMSAADGEVGQRGQAEIKEARELVAKARHFERSGGGSRGCSARGGAGRVVIDVAAVMLGRHSSTRCRRLQRDRRDACAALAAGDGAAAGPRLDECLGSANARGARRGGTTPRSPPRPQSSGVATPGGRRETNQTVRNRMLMAAATHLGLAKTAAPGQADAAVFERLTRRHALLEIILTDGVTHARLRAIEDALAGLRSAPKPCTLDEDLRHCSEEAADRAAGMAARDDVAMRLARGERDAPPPPPPAGRRPPPPRSASTNHPPPPPPMGGRPRHPSMRARHRLAKRRRARAQPSSCSSAGSPRRRGVAPPRTRLCRRPAPCAPRGRRPRESRAGASLLRWHPGAHLSVYHAGSQAADAVSRRHAASSGRRRGSAR